MTLNTSQFGRQMGTASNQAPNMSMPSRIPSMPGLSGGMTNLPKRMGRTPMPVQNLPIQPGTVGRKVNL